MQIVSVNNKIIKSYIQQMDSTLKQKLMQLTSKCQVLAKNGKYVQCIDIMQQIVSIKKQVYGMQHPQFEKASQKLCEYLNLAAMIFLQKQKFQQSLDCLKKAELVCRNSFQFKSTTYNNLACYYRRTGKVRTALTYLIQALQLQLRVEQPKTLADTHLNLCAVLSQLDRHEDALQHVMLSIILLQDQFLQICLPKVLLQQTVQQKPVISDERLAVLAIAYHNLGVQFQHLKRFEQAVKIYKKALQLSKDYLSDNQQLIQNLASVVSSATEQINNQKKSHYQSKRQKYERQMSQNKKQLYKQLAKNTQKLKNLPKLRINAPKQFRSSVDPMNRTSFEKFDKKTGNPNDNERADSRDIRHFATRKNPRYYKSYAVTPSEDDQSAVSGIIRNQDQSRVQSDASKLTANVT